MAKKQLCLSSCVIISSTLHNGACQKKRCQYRPTHSCLILLFVWTFPDDIFSILIADFWPMYRFLINIICNPVLKAEDNKLVMPLFFTHDDVCETWLLRKLDIKRITAFVMKCYRKILRMYTGKLIAPTLQCYINFTCFVRRQKRKYFGNVNSTQWVREDNNARCGRREKKQSKANRKIGERHHISFGDYSPV